MSIYWTLKDVPELAVLPAKERRLVHAQCLRRHFWQARATSRSVAAYASWIGIVALNVFAGSIVGRSLGLPEGFCTTFVAALCGAVLGSFVFSRIAIPALRPFYHEFIEREK